MAGRPILNVRVLDFLVTLEQQARARPDEPLAVVTEGGVVSSASPAAVARGVEVGRSVWVARRRCPKLSLLAPNRLRAQYFWDRALDICRDYSPLVEAQSDAVGEPLCGLLGGGGAPPLPGIFLDLTGTQALFGSPRTVAGRIRDRLKAELGLSCAIGLGPNKLVAWLAANAAGRGEVVEVSPGRAAEFVGGRPIRALSGFGAAGDQAASLEEMGLRRLGEVLEVPMPLLASLLGESAAGGLRQWAGGVDSEPVRPDNRMRPPEIWRVEKRLHLTPPTEDRTTLRSGIRLLVGEATWELRRSGWAAARLELGFGFRDSRQVAARRVLRRSTQSEEALLRSAVALLSRLQTRGRSVRWLRISVSRLSPAGSMAGGQLRLPTLVARPAGTAGRHPGPEGLGTEEERLAEAMDRIRDRYGGRAVVRASAMTL
jgi:DNA polymerase-4